jgi:hypothetical protein
VAGAVGIRVEEGRRKKEERKKETEGRLGISPGAGLRLSVFVLLSSFFGRLN